MNPWMILVPFSCALSCWLVARCIFVFIFHPQQSKNILGFRIQGALPARQAAIAKEVGRATAREVASMTLIEDKLADPSQLQRIMPVIEGHIDDFLRNKMKKEMPFLGMFVGDKTINSVKKVFMGELESLFPVLIKSYVANIVGDLNVEALVAEKIIGISVIEVETAFYRKFSREVRGVQLLAALWGLLTGVITLGIIYIFK